MGQFFETARCFEGEVVSADPLRIYTGILGQIGDIICFTGTVRRLRQLFPASQITFAVSHRYREAGSLIAGLPYVDRLFVSTNYCERITPHLFKAWELGWGVDVRGDDEVQEQRAHDVVLETRPRHRRMPWWEFDHQVAEQAHMVGVPGPIDLRTEISIPQGTELLPGTEGKIVVHNDPCIDATKAWPWSHVCRLASAVGPNRIVLLGHPGPDVPDCQDLRGKTTLSEAARIIQTCSCYVGIDSGLMWIAGSLEVPAVGLYGTSYIPAYGAIHPRNPRATYLQVEGDLQSIDADHVYEAVKLTIGRAHASLPLNETVLKKPHAPTKSNSISHWHPARIDGM
jgi:hypothetical protein